MRGDELEAEAEVAAAAAAAPIASEDVSTISTGEAEEFRGGTFPPDSARQMGQDSFDLTSYQFTTQAK